MCFISFLSPLHMVHRGFPPRRLDRNRRDEMGLVPTMLISLFSDLAASVSNLICTDNVALFH